MFKQQKRYISNLAFKCVKVIFLQLYIINIEEDIEKITIRLSSLLNLILKKIIKGKQ
nr:MAG TPA: hypothetical protein [Caudoviricetes sp.]